MFEIGREMQDISLEDFSSQEMEQVIFSPGDIYWCKENGGITKVLSAGDPVEIEGLNKYWSRNAVLRMDRHLNLDVVGEAKIYFAGLKKAKNEVQRLRHRQSFIRWFSSIFWNGSQVCSMVDLIQIGVEVFYQFPPEVTQRFKQSGINSFKRAGIMGSMGVFLALIMGHTDFYFLQDLYHLSYLFDCSFDGGISYNMNCASELERQQSGDGVAFLFLGENPGPELKQFVSHPQSSVAAAKKEFASYFNDPNIIDFIAIHHEKISGKGFPYSLHYQQLSDFESLLIFINHIVGYDDLELQKGGGIGFLKSMIVEYQYSDINEAMTPRLRDFIIDEITRYSALQTEEKV